MWCRIFTALLLAHLTSVFLLSVGRSAITDDIFASAVGTMNGCGDHGLFRLSNYFCLYFTTPFPSPPLPTIPYLAHILRPPLDESRGFRVGSHSHHPAMESRARNAGLLGRRTLASRMWALWNELHSAFVRYYSHTRPAPGSGRTRCERRKKYACGSTRSCFYKRSCAS